MWFFFLKADGSTGLTGSNVPIRHCILHSSCWKRLSNHASYCLSHNGTWCQTTWWPSSTFFYYIWLLLKRWMKTRASSRNSMSVQNLPTEYLIWIGLTVTFSLKTLYWWNMFSEHRRSCMHFIGVMSKYHHVVNEAKTVQRVCGNCDYEKTWCWVIPVWKQLGTIFIELICYLKENSPSGSLTLLTSSSSICF